MRTTITLTRNGNFRDNLRRYSGFKELLVPEAMVAGAVVLLNASQKLVPVDTEALKDSGEVLQLGSGFDVQTLVSYGAEDRAPFIRVSKRTNRTVTRVTSDYAIRQHQDITLNHPNGGQANFLKDPGLTMQPEIKAAIRGVMKK